MACNLHQTSKGEELKKQNTTSTGGVSLWYSENIAYGYIPGKQARLKKPMFLLDPMSNNAPKPLLPIVHQTITPLLEKQNQYKQDYPPH